MTSNPSTGASNSPSGDFVVLDKYRTTLDWWLVPLAKAFRNVHPDVFSWWSLVFAVAGGLAFWQSGPDADGLWLLAAAVVCVIVNAVLDLLDGKIAKITGKASPRGDYLDHCIDRFSDVAFVVGIAFSPWAHIEYGLVAVAGTLLTSYMGTQAQAVGQSRNYHGLLGRADRLVLLMVLPIMVLLWEWQDFPQPWQPRFISLLDVLLAYFAVVGIITTVQRFVVGLRGFGADGRVR